MMRNICNSEQTDGYKTGHVHVFCYCYVLCCSSTYELNYFCNYSHLELISGSVVDKYDSWKYKHVICVTCMLILSFHNHSINTGCLILL